MYIDPAANTEAIVTFLTPNHPSTPIAAQVVSISERRITIFCDYAAPVGTPLKVQYSGFLFLAEVLTSSPSADRTLVLHIRHALKTADVDYIRQKWI
jgi:hypothetical protein